MGEEAVRKYTEQAKFNQIRDSSLSNPLGQVLVPGFEVFPPVFGEMNSHILGSPVQALPTQCWREEKFLLRPHRFLPCILMSYNPWSYVQFDPTRLGEINNFFFFFMGTQKTRASCSLGVSGERRKGKVMTYSWKQLGWVSIRKAETWWAFCDLDGLNYRQSPDTN